MRGAAAAQGDHGRADGRRDGRAAGKRRRALSPQARVSIVAVPPPRLWLTRGRPPGAVNGLKTGLRTACLAAPPPPCDTAVCSLPLDSTSAPAKCATGRRPPEVRGHKGAGRRCRHHACLFKKRHLSNNRPLLLCSAQGRNRGPSGSVHCGARRCVLHTACFQHASLDQLGGATLLPSSDTVALYP